MEKLKNHLFSAGYVDDQEEYCAPYFDPPHVDTHLKRQKVKNAEKLGKVWVIANKNNPVKVYAVVTDWERAKNFIVGSSVLIAIETDLF